MSALEELKASGMIVADASQVLMDEFRAALAPVEADWIVRANEAGLSDPAEVLANFRAALASGSYVREA